LRAEETLRFIDRLINESSPRASTDPDHPIEVVVHGGVREQRERAAQAVLERLRECELRIAVVMDLRPRLADAAAALFAAGADEVVLAGTGVTALAWAETDDRATREIQNLSAADVLVRIRPSTGPLAVTIDTQRSDQVSGRVTAVLDALELPTSTIHDHSISKPVET
jgi:hypothetical protein